MKRSEVPSYIDYGIALAYGNFERAEEALILCLNHPGFQSDDEQYADILRRMGNIYFERGDQELALEYYLLSETCVPNSLLAKLHFAAFLGQKMGLKEEAISKCNEIAEISQKNPFEESDEDYGSSYYLMKSAELKRDLTRTA